MNGASDEGRDCEGQADHLSQTLGDEASVPVVVG